MTSPKVSVLMSCYNASAFLSEAIESVLAQTLTDFEFILVDDGSTDDTLTIIKDYAAKDKKIVVIEKENTGLTDSLNVGIRAAKGEWVARLDADDVALPNRLQDQIDFVSKNPKVVLVGTGCIVINKKGRIVKSHLYPADHDRLVRKLQCVKSLFPHSSVIFGRDAVIASGGYSERFLLCEDFDLWLRLSEVGEIACLPSHFIKLRRHDRQISMQDGGFTGALFGTAAVVSHFLRLRHIPDPSVGNEEQWKYFIDWLRLRLEQSNFLQMKRFYFTSSQLWNSERHQFFWQRVVELGKLVLDDPRCFIRIIQYKFLGTTLPVRLAEEWVQLMAAGRNKRIVR